MPHICVQSSELHAGSLVIVAIWNWTNHNPESCICQLWKAIFRFLACAFCQICRRSLVASPPLLSRLPKLTCTILQNHLHPLLSNSFGSIEIFQRQPGFESLQKICNRRLPVQGSIPQLDQTVLCRDNGPNLFLEKPSHPSFLPLVEHTKVRLPHSIGKLLQGEFHLLQADCSCAFSPTQVRRIIALILGIEFFIRNLW